jgi:hypothetical protein
LRPEANGSSFLELRSPSVVTCPATLRLTWRYIAETEPGADAMADQIRTMCGTPALLEPLLLNITDACRASEDSTIQGATAAGSMAVGCTPDQAFPAVHVETIPVISLPPIMKRIPQDDADVEPETDWDQGFGFQHNTPKPHIIDSTTSSTTTTSFTTTTTEPTTTSTTTSHGQRYVEQPDTLFPSTTSSTTHTQTEIADACKAYRTTEDTMHRPCVYPFTFHGKSYDHCAPHSGDNSVSWCATSADFNENGPDANDPNAGHWGICECD